MKFPQSDGHTEKLEIKKEFNTVETQNCLILFVIAEAGFR